VAVAVQTALGAAGDTSLRGRDVALLVAWALGTVIVAALGSVGSRGRRGMRAVRTLELGRSAWVFDLLR
jgi:hypothetical protein